MKYRGPALTPKLLEIINETTAAILLPLNHDCSTLRLAELQSLIHRQVRAAVMNAELETRADELGRKAPPVVITKWRSSRRSQ